MCVCVCVCVCVFVCVVALQTPSFSVVRAGPTLSVGGRGDKTVLRGYHRHQNSCTSGGCTHMQHSHHLTLLSFHTKHPRQESTPITQHSSSSQNTLSLHKAPSHFPKHPSHFTKHPHTSQSTLSLHKAPSPFTKHPYPSQSTITLWCGLLHYCLKCLHCHSVFFFSTCPDCL